jgi:hypothetical protein
MRIILASLAAAILLASTPLVTSCDAAGGCLDRYALTGETASGFARIALRCVQREFPNKPGHVANDSTEVERPTSLHPAFFGCFDWHSAVHGHWMLVRLLGLFPGMPEADEIRKVLGENLSAENILTEAAYFRQENRASFERTYGWAWLLKLAEEIEHCEDPAAGKWGENLRPLVDVIVENYLEFLPKQTYPIKRGVHPNTAFGLSFALDYARAAGNVELEVLIEERAHDYFAGATGCPASWEPDGDDFFSPCLMIADLMRRVLPPGEFGGWLDRFLPSLADELEGPVWAPAHVSDRSDPKIVHLDGLNLSRAWCMRGVYEALGEGDPRRELLERNACLHAEAALAHVASGSYEGEHWLASFAVFLLAGE